MGAFDHPALDEVREVLGEEGWTPEGKTDSETVVCVDIDDVAEAIVSRLSRRGYLR